MDGHRGDFQYGPTGEEKATTPAGEEKRRRQAAGEAEQCSPRRAVAPDYLHPDEAPGDVPDIGAEYTHSGFSEEYWNDPDNQTQDGDWKTPGGR